MFASLLSWLGSLSVATGTKACVVWLADEPKMPKSLLEK
jgi:cyclic lactone autoinducer peptide